MNFGYMSRRGNPDIWGRFLKVSTIFTEEIACCYCSSLSMRPLFNIFIISDLFGSEFNCRRCIIRSVYRGRQAWEVLMFMTAIWKVDSSTKCCLWRGLILKHEFSKQKNKSSRSSNLNLKSDHTQGVIRLHKPRN